MTEMKRAPSAAELFDQDLERVTARYGAEFARDFFTAFPCVPAEEAVLDALEDEGTRAAVSRIAEAARRAWAGIRERTMFPSVFDWPPLRWPVPEPEEGSPERSRLRAFEDAVSQKVAEAAEKAPPGARVMVVYASDTMAWLPSEGQPMNLVSEITLLRGRNALGELLFERRRAELRVLYVPEAVSDPQAVAAAVRWAHREALLRDYTAEADSIRLNLGTHTPEGENAAPPTREERLRSLFARIWDDPEVGWLVAFAESMERNKQVDRLRFALWQAICAVFPEEVPEWAERVRPASGASEGDPAPGVEP